MVMRLGLAGDPSLTRQKISPGTVRRIYQYARPYRVDLAFLVLVCALDAAITVAVPLMLREIINDGILRHNTHVIIEDTLAMAGLGIFDSVLLLFQGWASATVSQDVTYDMRMQVFKHVQQQPIAFFTRAQTGSLVSRLNTDVVAAQQAITTLLSTAVSSTLVLAFVFAALLFLSWLVTVAALLLIPLFIVLVRLIGRRVQRLTREAMQRNAELGSAMNERFNVSGALLVKLYGRPEDEADIFADRAEKVRDIGVTMVIYGRALFIALNLVALLATTLTYGLGGTLVANGQLQIGTLVAIVALLARIYTPISQMSNLQVNVMTALVSFDRTFEVLDLKPLITERPGAISLHSRAGGDTVPGVEFEHVCFRYPTAQEVSLASLESVALPRRESAAHAARVLHDVSFVAPPGQITALVGPSGAGKTTIAHLVSRMYDPDSGTVRIGGHDLRAVTLTSLRDTVGVVMQDAHLFHDTIRANLSYAAPDASEEDLIDACRSAQVWDVIATLPDGLDTVVGDRGYRLSGGEKQRLALARLLLKSPPVVVLDEATAHLDSESEAAVQRALRITLAGRTSLVIAHRLSTIRNAGQILVVDGGHVAERGTHEQLLAASGLYAALYRTQFLGQASEPSVECSPTDEPAVP